MAKSGKTLKQQINHYLNLKLKLITDRVILDAIRFPIKDHLQRSEEYRSMTSEDGGLRGMFGFEKGTEEAYVDAIIDRIVSEMRVEVTKKNINSTSIRLEFNIIVIDYGTTTIFSMDEAIIENKYIDEDGNIKIQKLPWLEWLLQKGNTRFLTGFHVEFSTDAPESRSGAALMFKGGSWGVPSVYAGTDDNNWITRALSSDGKHPKDDLMDAIRFSIEQTLGRILN